MLPLETWAWLHRVFSGKRTQLDSKATIRAEIPYRNIVSELDFFKNQITNYSSLVSRRKSTSESLNFEEITPFRSLEDEYGTIRGLSIFSADLLGNSITPKLPAIDLHGMISSKFKPSKLDFLPDNRLG